MSSRTITILGDDLTREEDKDGSLGVAKREWAVDGVKYEADLSDESYNGLLRAMTPYTSIARRVGGRKASKTTVVSAPQSSSTTVAPKKNNSSAYSQAERKKMREWLTAQGELTGDRGRISAIHCEMWETHKATIGKEERTLTAVN